MARSRPFVLICSGDESIGQSLRFVLTLEGVDCAVSTHPEAFLAAPGVAAAHCLVLEDNSCGQDGCALLMAARRLGAQGAAILLTGRLTPALRKRAEEAGVWRVFEKPVLDNALVEAILSRMPGREQRLSINT